jgi:hypothetical protein
MRDMKTPGIADSQACSDVVPQRGAPAMNRFGQAVIDGPFTLTE